MRPGLRLHWCASCGCPAQCRPIDEKERAFAPRCALLGIENPLVGFNHSPGVVAAVTNGGGIEVLYFVNDLLVKYGIPPVDTASAGDRFAASVGPVLVQPLLGVAFSCRISLVANAPGTPPPAMLQRVARRGGASGQPRARCRCFCNRCWSTRRRGVAAHQPGRGGNDGAKALASFFVADSSAARVGVVPSQVSAARSGSAAASSANRAGNGVPAAGWSLRALWSFFSCTAGMRTAGNRYASRMTHRPAGTAKMNHRAVGTANTSRRMIQ